MVIVVMPREMGWISSRKTLVSKKMRLAIIPRMAILINE